MAPRYENLKKLKEILAKRSLTLTEMASNLNTSERTIYRYLETLNFEDDGLIKDFDAKGKERYSLIVEETKPLSKNSELEKLLNQLSESGNHTAAIELEKLLSPDPDKSSSQERLVNTNKHFYLDPGPFAEHKALRKKNRHTKVIEAIEEKKILKLSYQKEDLKQNLIFLPCKYILRMGRLYLLGYEKENASELRILSDERILAMSTTGQSFTQSIVIDPIELYKYVFGQYIPTDKTVKPEKMVLSIYSTWLKSLLKESHFNPPAKFIEKSNRLEVHLELYITSEFTRWLMGCLPDLKIEKPLSLRRSISAKLSAALEKS